MNATEFGTDPTRLTLIAEAVRGQRWEELAKLYHPLLVMYARSLQVPDSQASDLVQDVWVKIFRKIDSFDHNKQQGSFRKWIRTIVRYDWLDKCEDQRRRDKRFSPGIDPESLGNEDDTAQSLFDAFETLRIVTEILNWGQVRAAIKEKVSELDLQVYKMIVYDGRRNYKVAEELGITPVKVTRKFYRVVNEVRRAFPDLDPDNAQ